MGQRKVCYIGRYRVLTERGDVHAASEVIKFLITGIDYYAYLLIKENPQYFFYARIRLNFYKDKP
jgi:hypothetical protein